MPTVPSSPRVKLRAATRRVPRARAAELEESEPEPNMKLSRAIVVMLLLHVVAIGGILAFSLIKERGATRHGSEDASAPAEAEDSQVPSATITSRHIEAARSSVHVVRPGETLTRIANENGVTLEALVAANGKGVGGGALHAGQELKLPEKIAAPAPRPTGPMLDAMQLIEGKAAAADDLPPAAITKGHLPLDSGKTYVVGKGESAYTIARKLKITPEALLKLNGIDDPKRLQPGQKLKLPAKAKN